MFHVKHDGGVLNRRVTPRTILTSDRGSREIRSMRVRPRARRRPPCVSRGRFPINTTERVQLSTSSVSVPEWLHLA